VVGLVAAVVGGTVETVETDTGTVDDVLEAVVVFVVVDAAAIDLVLLTVVDSRFWRLVSLTGRDPPGDPPSTSAPMHRAAKPSNPAQARQARHLRFCARERFIPSSSTVCRRT
jgi:pyruvate/2-oxoglutarate dehydrogenase complex dihydrolipoamide acyltransferase (E2) component